MWATVAVDGRSGKSREVADVEVMFAPFGRATLMFWVSVKRG